MKVNFFLLFLALALCGLIFFGFWKWTDANALYTWVSSVASLFFLAPTMAFSSATHPRGMAMAKVFSSVIFVVMLVANILFVKYEVSSTLYVIVNGAVFCLWAGVFYAIVKARQ